MDYKSDYRYEGKEKTMVVKASPLGPTFLFVLALAFFLLFFALWNAPLWWLKAIIGLGGLVFTITGVLLLRKKLELRVTEDSIIIDQINPFKKEPRLEFLISEVESVKKDYTSVSTGKGQSVEVYPIYLGMKDGSMKKVAEIVSDIKMADDIRRFLINRAGLKGGSL